jgi:hypothetical protein
VHNKDSAAPVPDRRIPSHPRRSHFANSVCKSRAERPRVPTIRTHCGQFAADLPENCGLSQCPVPTGTGHVPGADTPRHSMCTLFCGSQDPLRRTRRSAGRGKPPSSCAAAPASPMLHVAVAAHHLARARSSAPSNRRCWLDRRGGCATSTPAWRVGNTGVCALRGDQPPASAGGQSPACLRVPACSAVDPRPHGRALLAPARLPPARCIV